jgi:tripartite-type tricarboxylate transporter receptor subunit TctC
MADTFVVKRSLRRVAALIAFLALGSAPLEVDAQAARTIRILVGFPPGAGTDALARIYAEGLKDALGANVIVDNRPGAGGQIANQALKNAPRDGSVLMFAVDHQIVMLPHIMKDPGFDVERDFAPVARVATYNLCIAVHPGVDARDLAGLGTLVRPDSSKGNYGIPAPGSNAQFMGLVIGRHLGAELNPIPYKGAAPALIDLVGGQLPIAIAPCDAMAEFHRAGKLRIIANAAERRTPMIPDVPTLAEAGIKAPSDYFLAVYAPAGAAPEALERIREATRKLLATSAMTERIVKTGLTPAFAGAEELRRIGRESAAFWGEQIRQSGYQPQ